MKLPDKCENCEIAWDEDPREYLMIRTELDFDGLVGDFEINDQIYECSKCHTLYRARWQLKSFNRLHEYRGYHDVEEFYPEDEK